MFHHNSLRTGQSLADLIITSVTDPPVQVWAGKTFSATATVKNQGLIGPANAFSTTRYYLSHDPLSKSGATLLAGSSSVPLIPTGGTDTTGATPLTVPSGASPGTYYLLACADDTALIRETDKTNNCKAASGTTTIPVVAAGDINGDGRIDILDALLTLQYAVNLIPHTPDNNVKYLAVADVAPLEPATGMPKGDGKIDVFDALILLQRALDLTTW
jgi:subtilase family serine protease